MDFFILFLFYLVLVLLVIILVCFYSGRKQSLPSRLTSWLTQVLLYIIPTQVQEAARWAIHRLFHTRNCSFLALHLILESLVYAEYTWEVFGYCKELEFGIPVLLLPYLLLAVNTAFFTLCSRTNPGKMPEGEQSGRDMRNLQRETSYSSAPLPGTITKSNQALFLRAYAYDGVMFEKDVECATCKLRKPARSKHCSVCDSCVHRFDHHCIWVNNCIGAFNTRYFLIYLFTLASMAVSIAILTATFLVQVVVLSGMMLGRYADDQGQEHPVNVIFLIQHLFLTFPRVVFMLGFVVLLSIVLGSYFCFMLYLTLTNQTSNEWFKAARYQCPCAPHSGRQGGYKNIYSRGLWGNLTEIVKPLRSPEKKRRRLASSTSTLRKCFS